MRESALSASAVRRRLRLRTGLWSIKKKEHTLKNWQTHTIHYGFVEENGTILDEVMVSVMKAPRSYTTEDTVEINCHGGVLLTKRVTWRLFCMPVRGWRSRAKLTKRAFLSGRIDLSEAEAVMDLIQAKNQFSMQASIKNPLRGSVAEESEEPACGAFI